MRVFITGGAGYIGSHTAVEILSEGHEICVFDDFSNSSPVALERVSELTQKKFQTVRGDIRDRTAIAQAVGAFRPDAIVHFAGFKAVGESVAAPTRYYACNVGGTLNLLDAMDVADCKAIVFSSSATVYGTPHYLPYDEAHPLAPESPYGWSKLMAERAITDWAAARPGTGAALLRYFNPVGAHESGRIGEDPRDIPNNLMPIISRVAAGRMEKVQILGTDYDTPDGTGVRDYVHVADLARAHAAAVGFALSGRGAMPINVGTGRGTSVREMIAAFEAANNLTIPTETSPRRPGDIAAFYADPARAEEVLGWTARRGVSDMCASAWAWQSANPDGYGD